MGMKLNRIFFAELRENEILERIFEQFTDVLFFAKDKQSRFTMSNQNFWEKMGCRSEEGLIGKTDFDFFAPGQAEAYRQDDAVVLQTGISQINKLEIIPTADGLVEWYHTTKVPLRNKGGQIIGLLVITRDLRRANTALQPYRTLEPVIRYMLAKYADPIHASDLAKLAGLSLPRFTRRFKKELQVTPSRYLVMVRLNAACRLLVSTLKSISEIAAETGFHDHSFFTKQFVKYRNTTPKAYRVRYSKTPGQASYFPLGVAEQETEN
jgi:PAS domain S-box-containing protein